jgi:hypothetical protein
MTPPFWNSLEITKLIHSWAQGLAIFSLILLVVFEAVAHWHKKETVVRRFNALAIVALALLAIFDSVGWIYTSRWETLQQRQADSEIKAANKRARDAEEAVKNLPKPIILTSLAHANFGLSGRWGDKASLSSISGDSRSFSFTVTANGKGLAMQPFVEISYPDSASKSTHARLCIQTGGTGMVTDIRWDANRDKMRAVYLGLPLADRTYIISCN